MKRAWVKIEQGPVEYAKTGTKRVTYWLRLGREIVKITNRTPSQYDAAMMAIYQMRRAFSLEYHNFGYANVEKA